MGPDAGFKKEKTVFPFISKLKTFKLCSIFGIPVCVNVSFFLIGLLMVIGSKSLAMSLTVLVGLGASLVAHELAHCYAAYEFGYKTHAVTLHMLGAVAEVRFRSMIPPKQEIIIAAAGPVMSIVLAGLFAIIATLLYTVPCVGAAIAMPFASLAAINFVLFTFNILPGFPMDGGRILRGALTFKKGPKRATYLTMKTAHVFAYVLGAAGIAMLVSGIPNGILSIVIAAFVYIYSKKENEFAEMTLP